MRDGVMFSPDGRRALLVAQTRAPGFDLDAQAGRGAGGPRGVRARRAGARCGS